MTKAKLTSKGQITLPKRVRVRLGLAMGDVVEFVEDGGEFRLRRHVGESPFAPYRGHLSRLRGESPDAIVEELRGRP
ncbi:MAG: AbrB/MazE/SpoVT family DNA-binding domain-containing protein [Methanothrix sp.]|nr:AbrB/MazE/SpoVT family DNA-binding domain-containing protein [Methanothrix sp.]MBC7170575.1 AbrB/MazE/SpoVT family DNA-binding domain-containing protein [Candidatus Bipolaricaulota bacterium]